MVEAFKSMRNKEWIVVTKSCSRVAVDVFLVNNVKVVSTGELPACGHIIASLFFYQAFTIAKLIVYKRLARICI